MIKREVWYFCLVLCILNLGCSKDDNNKNKSATLQISWDKLSDYSYYLFISQRNDFLQDKNVVRSQSENISPQYYIWDEKDISLYSVAIEKWAIEKNIYPESDSQGSLHLKQNNKIISLENQDLLIAGPQRVISGETSTRLSFRYGMSLLKVVLELSAVEGYIFDIQAKAVKDGYINMEKGNIVPEGQVTDIYFLQNKLRNNEYEAVIIPQQLAKNTILSITGIKTLGEKILRIDYPIVQLTLEASKEYTWSFNTSSTGITYKNFSEAPRLVNK